MSPSGPTVRIYSPFLPFPVTEGAFQVIYDQARTLAAAGARVELVCWKDGPLEIARKLGAPTPGGFDGRIVITCLRGETPRTARAEEWRAAGEEPPAPPPPGRLERAGRVARAVLSPWASPELYYYPFAADRRALLPRAEVGIYHYSFCYPWLVRGGSPTERRTFVHLHNRESDLSRLRAATAPLGPAALVHRLNAARLRTHEERIGELVDELWFLSPEDIRGWQARDGRGRARHVPPTFHLAARGEASPTVPPPAAGIELGFLGGCHFEPNRLSLEWIVNELAPALRRRGFDGEIRVAGRGVPAALRRRALRYRFFRWLGFVPDLDDFWNRLTFLLVPHVAGSGVRIKLLEALASGVPVLANGAALAALAPDVATSPLIARADDAEAWADLILAEPPDMRRALHGDSARGTSLQGAVTYRFLLESLGLTDRQAPSPSPGIGRGGPGG